MRPSHARDDEPPRDPSVSFADRWKGVRLLRPARPRDPTEEIHPGVAGVAALLDAHSSSGVVDPNQATADGFT